MMIAYNKAFTAAHIELDISPLDNCLNQNDTITFNEIAKLSIF